MAISRYQRALIRNLHEVGLATLERRAIIGLDSAGSYHGVDFSRVSRMALFNDMIAHSIKVLDRNRQSSSFWYLRRCETASVDGYASANGISIPDLEGLSDKLKHIRDKTHFHIDRYAVF